LEGAASDVIPVIVAQELENIYSLRVSLLGFAVISLHNVSFGRQSSVSQLFVTEENGSSVSPTHSSQPSYLLAIFLMAARIG
jgi:hypothetical protein